MKIKNFIILNAGLLTGLSQHIFAENYDGYWRIEQATFVRENTSKDYNIVNSFAFIRSANAVKLDLRVGPDTVTFEKVIISCKQNGLCVARLKNKNQFLLEFRQLSQDMLLIIRSTHPFGSGKKSEIRQYMAPGGIYEKITEDKF